MKPLDRNYDLGLLILRLSIGILMLLHGITKIANGIAPIQDMVVAQGMPDYVAYGVYIGEVLAPILIVLGLATRLGALMFAINCGFAFWFGHSADLFILNEHGGWALELLGLYFIGSVVLFFTGGGKYSLSYKQLWD